MKLTHSLDSDWAETKFLFSDGKDPDQPYRIDFIYKKGLCRITAAKKPLVAALLDLVDGQTYAVGIRVHRNFLDIEVDGLSIFRGFQFGKRSDGRVALGTYNATARFDNITIVPLESKTCFVIMAFDEKRNFLYEYVLRPMLQDHPRFKFEFERADEALTTGRITKDITDAIDRADLVVADVSMQAARGYNPNVFYELGYTHLIKRKAILLVEKAPGQRLELPFDTKDFRHHSYEFSKAGFEELRRHLDRLVVSVVA
jgi:hypothetical protein